MARCYKCGKSETTMLCVCEECAQDSTIDKVIKIIGQYIAKEKNGFTLILEEIMCRVEGLKND